LDGKASARDEFLRLRVSYEQNSENRGKVPLQDEKAEVAKVDKLASAGAPSAARGDAEQGPSKRRLEQLATIWARQTGRKIVVA
jgi:hypothetical protein